jgi:hypothetical protein
MSMQQQPEFKTAYIPPIDYRCGGTAMLVKTMRRRAKSGAGDRQHLDDADSGKNSHESQYFYTRLLRGDNWQHRRENAFTREKRTRSRAWT